MPPAPAAVTPRLNNAHGTIESLPAAAVAWATISDPPAAEADA
jgi:hypothetical protein